MEVSVSHCGFASRMWKRLVRVSFLFFSSVARGGGAPLWCCVAGVHIVSGGESFLLAHGVVLAAGAPLPVLVIAPCVVSCVALSVVRQALVVTCVRFPLSLLDRVCLVVVPCFGLGLSEVDMLPSTSTVVLLPVWLCVALVSLEADGGVSCRFIRCFPLWLSAMMYSVRFHWRWIALLTGVSRVAAGNCALCWVLLATEWVAGRWVTIVRSVGDCNCEDFGWHFLLFGPDLASLSTGGVVVPFGCPTCGWSESCFPLWLAAMMYSIRFRWRWSALLTGVSRVAAGNCALCWVLLATEWVARRWVTIVRSVSDCNCEDFGWHFLLFGPDLASLSTGGVVVPLGDALVSHRGCPIQVAASVWVTCWLRPGSLSHLTVALDQWAATVFCRVALSGRLTPVRVAGAEGLRHWSATPSLSLSSSSLLPLPPAVLRLPLSPLSLPGEEEGCVCCRGIVDLACGKEEVANRREGPHWGSFFMKRSVRASRLLGLSCATSQQFSVVLLCCPACSLFARCLALEGLSRSEVVSISWDPHPRELVEGVLRATSMLELAAHVWDVEGFRLGQAAVLRVLCVSVAALSRPCVGAEAGARLASRACGVRVPLLAASGGGSVVVVVTTPVLLVVSASVFSRFRGPILVCQPVMASECVASRPGIVSRVQGGSACWPSTL
ncbi:hypothetical protein Taro_047873 [Colocasia esculenta]|uniref:Uncharacterized protein n=1 Tax=Colocasia esculenta TaxID=4460 RepID=A0A843X1N7_COLES|nr:hypothetical protein [Colocasia esculenta]